MDPVEKVFSGYREYVRQADLWLEESVRQANKATHAEQLYHSIRSNYLAILDALDKGTAYESIRKISKGRHESIKKPLKGERRGRLDRRRTRGNS